jgi:hypothetical protein
VRLSFICVARLLDLSGSRRLHGIETLAPEIARRER